LQFKACLMSSSTEMCAACGYDVCSSSRAGCPSHPAVEASSELVAEVYSGE
jgi:hypothetical protein